MTWQHHRATILHRGLVVEPRHGRVSAKSYALYFANDNFDHGLCCRRGLFVFHLDVLFRSSLFKVTPQGVPSYFGTEKKKMQISRKCKGVATRSTSVHQGSTTRASHRLRSFVRLVEGARPQLSHRQLSLCTLSLSMLISPPRCFSANRRVGSDYHCICFARPSTSPNSTPFLKSSNQLPMSVGDRKIIYCEPPVASEKSSVQCSRCCMLQL